MIYIKKKKEIKKINQQGISILENTSETTRYNANFVLAKNKKFLNWFLGYIDSSENCFIVIDAIYVLN